MILTSTLIKLFSARGARGLDKHEDIRIFAIRLMYEELSLSLIIRLMRTNPIFFPENHLEYCKFLTLQTPQT